MSEKVLLENRFAVAETKRNQWFATCPQDITPDDVLRPDYWAHIARMLNPLDEIIVTVDTCAWRSVLLVEDAWNTGARVQRLSHHDLTLTEEPENTEGLRVQWRGPHAKWCVTRKDGATLKERLPNRETAMNHMVTILASRRD
jgi:hypothetical protein